MSYSLQAFTIAAELGIACALTPNMMLLSDIPDKLAVIAFVYQMYNFFTKSNQSVITAYQSLAGSIPVTESSNSPGASSPFDIRRFGEFLVSSPVETAPERSGVDVYSRHTPKAEQDKKSAEVEPPKSEITQFVNDSSTKEHKLLKASLSTPSVVREEQEQDTVKGTVSPVRTVSPAHGGQGIPEETSQSSHNSTSPVPSLEHGPEPIQSPPKVSPATTNQATTSDTSTPSTTATNNATNNATSHANDHATSNTNSHTTTQATNHATTQATTHATSHATNDATSQADKSSSTTASEGTVVPATSSVGASTTASVTDAQRSNPPQLTPKTYVRSPQARKRSGSVSSIGKQV